MTENLAEDLDELARELDRDHVFHSWSAQAQPSSLVIASGRGAAVWDHAGREYLDFSSQLVNVNIGHQHPAVVQAIREQAELLTTIAPSTVNLARGEAAKRIVATRRPDSTRCSSPTAAPTPTRTRSGWRACTPAATRSSRRTARTTATRARRSSRPATGGACPNEFARGHVHFFGPYLYRSEFWATTPEEESERALHHLRRVIEAEGPSSIAAILLETIPGTAGSAAAARLPRRRPRALPTSHGILLILDEVMCGFGRSGRWFAFDGYDVRPRPDHLREGRELGLRARGRRDHLRPDRRDVRRPRVPGRAHLLGAPARDGVDRRDARCDGRRRASSRTRAAIGATRSGPRSRTLAERHRRHRRGARRGRLLGDRTRRRPRDPRTAARRAMGRIKSALVARGLLPFVQDNRIHVVPPCVVTAEEVAEAMPIYDEVLSTALEGEG